MSLPIRGEINNSLTRNLPPLTKAITSLSLLLFAWLLLLLFRAKLSNKSQSNFLKEAYKRDMENDLILDQFHGSVTVR